MYWRCHGRCGGRGNATAQCTPRGYLQERGADAGGRRDRARDDAGGEPCELRVRLRLPMRPRQHASSTFERLNEPLARC